MKKPALVAQHRAGGEVTSIWKDNSVSNGINNAQQDTTGQGRTQADAQEFGQHVRQGGWRLGLLVARNVVRAPGRVSIETLAPKTNATRFGELSGVSTTKVLRYLAAWNLAAEQGIVPPASDLAPGSDVDLDVDTLPSWSQFYEAKNTSGRQPEPIKPSVEEVAEAVKSNPEIAKAVAEHVEPTREQVTKAMRSNPEIEQAARDEAWDMTREKARANSSTYNPDSRSADDLPEQRTAADEQDDLGRFTLHMRQAKRALRDALTAARRLETVVLDPDEALTGEVRELCDLIDSTFTAGGFDAQLAALIDEETGR